MSFTSRKANVALWVVQTLLAALFLFAGGFKLAAPSAALAQMSPFSPLFIKFIGLCEFLGGLGLVLPGLFRIRTWLTPLAAVGLSIIMIGAVATTVATLGASQAGVPLVVGVLTTIIARGRQQRARHLRAAASFPAHIQTAGGAQS